MTAVNPPGPPASTGTPAINPATGAQVVDANDLDAFGEKVAHAAAFAMTLARKASQALSSESATHSSALCAWSMEPGPQITAGMPARWKCPASVP